MRRTRWLAALLLVVSSALAGPGLAGSASAAYPGADGKLAFVRAGQIYTISPNGLGLRQLTSGTPSFRPRWSPDGKRIAYVHQTSTKATDLWVMQADGSGKTQVTRLGKVTGGSWSPDGAWLAFGGASTTGQLDLLRIRMTAPFATPSLVTAGSAIDGPPAWSPSGYELLFYAHACYSNSDNCVVSYDLRSGVTTSVVEAGYCCGYGYFGDPAWAANGGRYAFTGAQNKQGIDTNTLPPPTVRVYTASNVMSPFATRSNDQQPAFAPSGRYVALVNGSTSPPKVLITNADGSGRRVLTTGYHPDWQPLR